jgi:hypothetical protein
MWVGDVTIFTSGPRPNCPARPSPHVYRCPVSDTARLPGAHTRVVEGTSERTAHSTETQANISGAREGGSR